MSRTASLCLKPTTVSNPFVLLAAGCVLAMVSCAFAEDKTESVPDKSGYTFLNPTPAKYMRQFSGDRPDKTDSAFTVDAGHFQLEMDFANFGYDHNNPDHTDVRVRSYELAPMNWKVGLLNNVDFQLALTPYRWERTDDHTQGTVERKAGFGDVTPRVKVNLVGNDGGPFALALMPYIKLPTNQDQLGNNSVEWGLKVPYSFEVPGWDVSMQTEVDVNRDEVGASQHPEFINSISVGHPVVGKLSYYVEFFSNINTARHASWEGTLDTWFNYQVNENLRFEAGVYIGLTKSAEDWHPFIGVTKRF